MILSETYKLYNGVEIPKIGFGTWQTKSGKEAYDATTYALQAGYRHIDTAYVYENEQSVGQAILDSKIKREEKECVESPISGDSGRGAIHD